MTADAILNLAIRGSFLFVAILTLINLIRHRDSARVDIALPFVSLALVILIPAVRDALGVQAPWISFISGFGLLVQPYLFVRLLKHFRAVPALIERTVLIGLVLSMLVLVLTPSPLPTGVTLAVVAYFVIGLGYSVVAFVGGAFQTRGVTRWQLLLVAIGTFLFALILLIATVGVLLPDATIVVSGASRVIAILSAFSYYFGFASPRWLRLIWQRAELHHFLQGGDQLVKLEQRTDAIIYLCRFAVQAVGGQAAIVALWDESSQRLVIAEQDVQSAGSILAVDQDDVVSKAWYSQKPIASVKRAEFGLQCASRADALGAGALYVIPIAFASQSVGMLLVFLRGALFPEDDIEMLMLFAGQEARAFRFLDLIAKVSELNKHLTERAEELETANKELESFSYSVSHDLRAPLRAVDGFSRILLEDYSESLPSEATRYLGLVRDAAQQMGRLIDDLLSFSRLGRQQLKTQSVELTGLAQQVFDELAAERDGRKIDIVIREIPLAEGDASLLKQVFANLLANALKFTRQRETAQIEVGFTEAGGEQVYFVKDNGAGFDMKYVDKLFGVFQRLHRMEEFEGTGVGLATVQRIIHRHGGRIWAEAAIDEGATFYFTLKARDDHGA